MSRRWGVVTVVLAGLSSGSVTVGALLLVRASVALSLVTALPVAIAGGVATGLWLWPTFGDVTDEPPQPGSDAFGGLPTVSTGEHARSRR